MTKEKGRGNLTKLSDTAWGAHLKRRGKIAKLNFIVRDLAEMKAPKEIEKNLKKVLDKQG